MQRKSRLKNKFLKMLEDRQYDNLARYEKRVDQGTLSEDEKKLLAALFFLRGEEEIIRGDNNVYRSFELASKLDPENPTLFFGQAQAYLYKDQNPRCVSLACGALHAAVSIDKEYYEAWHSWANALVRLGMHHHDPSYFMEADDKFKEAAKILEKQNRSDPEFMASWGFCWFSQGQLSGEAGDYKNAINLYREAEKLGIKRSSYCKVYAEALSELASLLDQPEIYDEAIKYIERSIQEDPSDPSSWYSLGCVSQKIYERILSNCSGKEFSNEDFDQLNKYYLLSDSSFCKSSELCHSNPMIWFRWAQLDTVQGKIKMDAESLAKGLEKFEKANQLDPDQPPLLGFWADALLTAGMCLDDVTLMQDAKNKITHALELQPEEVDFWYIYGNCLRQLGYYFDEESYYYQAIEKFHYGLSLNPTHNAIWHALALSQYALGEITEEPIHAEKAVKLFRQCLEKTQKPHPQLWNDVGVALMKLGEFTNQIDYVLEALGKFENAISPFSDDPELSQIDPEWLYNYGCALDWVGENMEEPEYFERSIKALDMALRLSPNYSHARYSIALSYFHLGLQLSEIDCFYKALENFQVLLTNDPEDEMGWNESGCVCLHLAELVIDKTHPEKSQEYYQQAESRFHFAVGLGCTQAYYNLACLYSLLGKYSDSLHYIEKAETNDALPPLDQIMHDEWLDGLRKTNSFWSFIAHLSPDQKTYDP